MPSFLTPRPLAAAALAIFASAAHAGPVRAEPAPLIALSCASCHGPGAAGEGSIPGIAGVPQEDFIRTWEAFRSGERTGTIMNRIARGYTPDEVATLAAYFASLD